MLILDDNELWLRSAMRELRQSTREDLAAFYARNADEALIHAHRQVIDLAIVDLHLTSESRDLHCASGISVIKALKATCPPCVAVLTSAHLTTKHVDLARDAGASFSEPKPVSIMGIIARVEGTLMVTPPSFRTITLARAEWEHIHRVVGDSGNNISEAARRLGIHRSVLQRKLRRVAPPAHAQTVEETFSSTD
ncbi:MAG TPA: helix-turn-helix domain-containing protein [Kofleriaceae bacterium]|nr:helix-turn-helix domain-containing protein [Kofleriaceae bacterium]